MFDLIRGQRSCIASMFVLAVVPASATIIIDPFTTAQSVSVPARGAGAAAAQNITSNSSAGNAPAALGGQRELLFHRLYGTSAGRLNTDTDNFGAATFNTGSNGVANGLIVWDGPGTGVTLAANGRVPVANATSAADADAKVDQYRFGAPDTMGLGAIDLTESGSNDRIRLRAYADNDGTQIVFKFFVTASKYSQFILNIPGSSTFGYTSYDVPFSSFTGFGFGANENFMKAFTGTNAITMQINGGASTDASFDFFAATTVPEPVTTSLIGGGLVLLGMLKGRRNRV